MRISIVCFAILSSLYAHACPPAQYSCNNRCVPQFAECNEIVDPTPLQCAQVGQPCGNDGVCSVIFDGEHSGFICSRHSGAGSKISPEPIHG